MADNKTKNWMEICTLNGITYGPATLLDAVERDDAQIVDLFFTHDTPIDSVEIPDEVETLETRTIGNAPWITVRRSMTGPFNIRMGGQPVEIKPNTPEWKAMAGRDVAVAVRNGESAEIVLDWIQYHHRNHGMTGALIVSRSKPGSDLTFARDVEKGLRKSKVDCRVIVVQSDHPLGHADLPPEAHPFCVPEAPGKDRMTRPDAAPWASPLAEVLVYEWARARFLNDARALCNIDVHDLVLPIPGTTVFDAADNSQSGYVQLLGEHCYPWRVRKDHDPAFADHVCVQFDSKNLRQRWCVAPDKLSAGSILRLVRVAGASFEPEEVARFFRFMAIRHPTDSVSRIVPKSSLVECPPLIDLMAQNFEHKPVRVPEVHLEKETNGRRAIITTMKNEGPFILEWIAYHRAIGIDDFLVYTNDCTDGTDTLLDVLQDKGIVQHRDNPFKGTGLKPQHAALEAAEQEPTIAQAEWAVCMDVDEFINVKCGDGTLDALFDAIGDANMIAMTWRLFGNSDIHDFIPGFITDQFTQCAPELSRKPHQAWGFKTLFRNVGIFKKLGVHRPKGLKPQLWDRINWVNGSGKPMPKEMFRNAWRSTLNSYGYDLVQLNHYAVRSAESFLVKRDRGRVNHVDRDQGLAYWFRMNNNADRDTSISRVASKLKQEFDFLMQDVDIATAHEATVKAHRAKITELRATKNYADFFTELTGDRMQKLSRLHANFGANVFLQGPECVPDEILQEGIGEDFFFTVEKGKTEH